MKNTIAMKKAMRFTFVVMLAVLTMMYVFALPAKADWNSYVGTYQCAENRTVELKIYDNGTAVLYSNVNPYLGGNYTYFINQNGFLCTSDGTAFATNGSFMSATNGYHWIRIY